MKTLFLITSLEQGGIETYLLRYLEYFQEHEAIVICKSGGLGELYPQYTQMVRVIPMYFSYFGGVRYYRYYKLLKGSRSIRFAILPGILQDYLFL